jgi:Ran GTPase-activating protein (RanGAP) involved in mRNA processing and transport
MARGLRDNGNLRTVRLRYCFAANGNALDDDTLAELIQSLEYNLRLQTLDVSGNKCLVSGIAAIATVLDRTKLERLNLSSQCIQSNESLNVSLLVAALARTTTLQTIDFRFNKLIDQDMAYLAASLSHNTSIQFLGLASNNITNTGLSILASRIPLMRGLKHIVLTNNLFDAYGADELAQALELNYWSLERVDCDPRLIECSPMLRYYPDLNFGGRRLLHHHTQTSTSTMIRPGLWALVLERANAMLVRENGIERCANILYYLLREGPALLER